MKIPIDQITILNPSTNHDEIQLTELADSMKEFGLSHQIIVREANILGQEDGVDENQNKIGYILASGERRLIAAKRLGWTEIEADIRAIDDKQSIEIRIHENLRRVNLQWFEAVVLVEQLHNLRQEEYGVATRGRPTREERRAEFEEEKRQGWSIRDTAEELGVGIGNLSEDLSLARALRNDPTLAKVRDKKTAIKLVRQAAVRYQSELEAGRPSGSQDYFSNEVMLGDSEELLKHLPDNSIDHCITDPPWIKFFDPELRLDDRTLPVFKQLYRVLKHGSFLYVFCGLDDYAYYAGVTLPDPNNPSESILAQGELQKVGFQVSKTPIVWQKLSSLSRRGVRQWEYERDFEFILVAVKGNPALVSSRQPSGVKPFKIVPPVKQIHPNEKPIEILEDILADCSYPKNLIVDPFGGSGSLAEACLRLGRRYLICERDKDCYDAVVKRLADRSKK